MDTKKQALEKLKGHIKPDTGKWKEDVQWRRENRGWLRKSQKIAFDILQTLRAQKRSQKDLAAAMNVSPQQVNKWVKGRENFTLETIDKLERALGVDLLQQGQQTQSQALTHSFKTHYEAVSAEKEKIQSAEGGTRVIKLNPSEFTIAQQTG
ncbi:helix-turn-helix transcriptional regulator [Antarcticibacterium arcticum]|uniref:Helix-turn-helix transcriptional regulator n=2 Tax=Antarcticibacterium arcticum TaxID=2585771 RepID=A0A5B8YM25_9FLAO|nr:helix-turn-helix transcriptional regulator [Antarcticibacterium arcticum]